MELVEARKKVEEVVKQNKYMFEIPIKEAGTEMKKFCEQNDIERHSEEYTILMNMMRQEMQHWFEFALAIEILKGGKISDIPPEDFDNL